MNKWWYNTYVLKRGENLVKDKIWAVFTFISILAISLFIIFIIFAFIEMNASNDYRFAIIGALGSIIGGSLTLVGVQITLNKQKNENYISDFPKIITHLDLVKSEINRINNENHSFLNLTDYRVTHDRKEYFYNLKKYSTNIDGIVYFIIKNLEKEFEYHILKSKELVKYDDAVEAILGKLTTESSSNINKVKKELLEIINDTIRKIEEHEEKLTKKFLKIMK